MITIPKVSQIRDQIIADIEAKIGQTIPALPKAFFRVLATAQAGVIVLLYRFGAWEYDQIFPQTAGPEALGRIGEQYGIIRRPAVAAILTATATGASDTIIPIGTLWQADGVVYQQEASIAIAAGTATITIDALTTGDATNLANGSIVSLVTPIAGVDTDATIASTVTSGADIEDIEAYRLRVLQRLQQRPQGGAIPDYIAWSLEVPGIVRAFVELSAPGEVTVYPLEEISGADRIPDAGKLTEVETYLTDENRKPLCATVQVSSSDERIIDITVSSLSPDNADVRQSIEDAWTAYLYGRYPRQYVDDAAPTNVISLAGIYAEAIGAGANNIVATLEIDGVPGTITQHTLLISEIVTIGSTTWPV
jgi:uncharacterized phage protein gp47/JayE